MKKRNWTLTRGNSLRGIAKMADNSVDATCTDPPYCSVGSASQASSKKYLQTGSKVIAPDFAGDTRDARSWLRWTTMWLEECHRVTKQGGVLCVFTDWRMLPLLTDAVQIAGWIWQGIVSWDKTEGTRPRRGGFRAQCEYVVWASKGKLVGNPDVVLPGSFTLTRPHAERPFSQVGKPEQLMRRLVQVAPVGGTVLDPFSGGGTTGVACLAEGRKFIGFELSPAQYRIAEERLKEAA